MVIIKELENKIKILMSSIALSKKNLENHELGTAKLSLVAQASAEHSIERNTYLLNKYNQKLRKLNFQDINKLRENEDKKEKIRKHNYFKYQTHRIKRDKTKTDKERDEILFIIDDLDDELQVEDIDLFEISRKSTHMYLRIHSELNDELKMIKNEFHNLVIDHFDISNNDLKLLNYRIPIIVLQLRVILQNIKENIEDEKLNKFKGMPKFQDWWINELWTSHQAYMGLFKWKKIVQSLFVSDEQKNAFEIIFKNWIMVKKILNVKGEVAYTYNNAFDQMIKKYAELEDEYEKENLDSLKNIIKEITAQENFLSVGEDHNTLTSYMKFKIQKKHSKEEG